MDNKKNITGDIKIYTILEKINIDDLYNYLICLLAADNEFVLDFAGISLLNTEDITNLMSICMRLRDKGCTVKVKNVPVSIKKQFLLSGEVITL